MSDHFITNKKGTKSLSDIINGILPKKDVKVDFLVGYFYFSGMKEIYQNIPDKQMRVLVGLDMDNELINRMVEYDKFKKKKVTSRQQIRDENLSTIVKLFNETDHFEIDDNDKAFKIYYEKIKNGTLEIRKTVEPSHAKMYIFTYGEEDNEDGEVPGTIITGSSNLTYSGLKGQNEINVRFTSKSEFKDASEIFENLWENAIVIVDKDHITEFNEGVIKHIWFEKIFPPYLFYLRVLYEYFKIDYSKHVYSPSKITGGKYYNLKYQEDAIRMGISTIEKHNGVIISDVVGLGKSIIGASIAHNLKLRTIVIAPPHLVPQWDDYCQEFHVTARIFSSGKIASALENYRSKTRLNEKWLIIIDEAHNYRNEFTQDYALLHDLCQGNKVMLLTATPFNNQPSDIYSMVKLFQIPTKSTLRTVDNLGESFKELISRYKELKKSQKNKKITKEELNNEVVKISENIRNIISPLIIRRSRLDLSGIPDYKDDLSKQKIKFPEVNDPIKLDYNLGDLSGLYISTLQRISPNKDDEIDQEDYLIEDDVKDNILSENQFKATRYKPALYVKEEYKKEVRKKIEEVGLEYNLFIGSQRNLAKFMRTLLVRRFESSQKAFMISLGNMLNNSRNILTWAEKRGAVPVYKKGYLPDIKSMYDSNKDSSLEAIDQDLEDAIEKLKPRGLFEINTDYLTDDFFVDLKQDIRILETLQKEWSDIEKDPKLETFIETLKEKLKEEPKRKLVIFSQFADTVEYLSAKLKKVGLPVFSYTSKDSSKNNKEIIKENFDAGYEIDRQKNDYKILIATDAISEGYNLHRAGAIFNYDIPYNPTRVIQRVGRINRINKKMFDELFIYNYFPTAIGEKDTRTKEIVTLKMAMIHTIMGEDTKIFTSDEQLNAYFIDVYKKQVSKEEVLSWDTKYRAVLSTLENSPEMKEALKLPLRSKVRRKYVDCDISGILIFALKGNDYIFKYASDENNITDISPQKAFELLVCEINEKGYEVSKQFNSIYTAAKEALFTVESEVGNEKSIKNALDKIRLMIKKGSCDIEYLEDLKTAVELDSISGYALRLINRLLPRDYGSLPDLISIDYIKRILQNYDSVDQGPEALILAEEIQNY